MGQYDEIRGARVVLRRWDPRDRAPFAALNADPEVMRHFPAALTTEQSEAFADRIDVHFDAHGYGLWAVDVGGEFAGFTGVCWTEGLPFSPALEIGWRLARPFWGRGYATEAARLALEVGLEVADSVVSFTAVCNERSWHVMERLGMHREGTFDHPRVPDDSHLRRHYLYRTL
jgi:RimJ/RimL family protein N-acetyltransferase